MKLDFASHKIILKNQEINLTKTENEILKILYTSNNRVVKSNELIKIIYKTKPDNGLKTTLRKHISLLNKKLNANTNITIRNVASIGYFIEESIERKAKKDLQYIAEDIVTKRKDGNYCRFSRILNAVSVESITYERYIEHWQRRYKDYPEKLPEFLKACQEKLIRGLTDKEEFIKLVQNSTDKEENKEKIIKSLGGRY